MMLVKRIYRSTGVRAGERTSHIPFLSDPSRQVVVVVSGAKYLKTWVRSQ